MLLDSSSLRMYPFAMVQVPLCGVKLRASPPGPKKGFKIQRGR